MFTAIRPLDAAILTAAARLSREEGLKKGAALPALERRELFAVIVTFGLFFSAVVMGFTVEKQTKIH